MARCFFAIGLAFVVGGELVSVQALAQDTEGAGASAPTPRASGVEEIVVTAQRRAERLQDVPIAVTALTASALTNARVATVEDIAILTPGLSMTQLLSNVMPYLRGVGTQNVAVGEESSVATYVDGVYMGALAGSNFSLPNVERIEVLKGPQGTLFGRNATGGLIQIITRDPGDTPQVQFNIEGANYGTVTAKVYAGGPLTSKLAADISGYYTNQTKGFGTDVTTGKEANRAKEYSVRAKFVWRPGDDTKVKLSLDADNRRSDIGLNRRLLPGAISSTGISFPNGGPYDSQNQEFGLGDYRQAGAMLSLEHTFSAFTFQSTTAYRNYSDKLPTDNDGGPVFFLSSVQNMKTRTVQQEFLLNGTAGRLNWTGGVFLYRANAEYTPLALYSGLVPGQRRNRFASQITESAAVFGQGTYAITDSTNFTAGGRYTFDNKKFSGVDLPGVGYAGPPLPGRLEDTSNFKQFTWRLALDQKLGEGVMAYASASRGYKSGEYNVAVTATAVPVNPETLNAYEIGLKSQLFGQRLRANISAFRYDYKNIQLQLVVPGATVLYNAASARINGVDAELGTSLDVGAGRFDLSAGATYLDAKYKSFPGAPFLYPNPAVCNAPGTATPGTTTGPATGGDLAGCFGDASGHQLIRTPKFSASVTVGFTVPIGDGELGTSLTVSHSGKIYFDPDNRISQPSYTTLNGNIGYTINRSRFYVFAKNLTDERYLAQSSSSALGDFVTYAAPRIFGGGIEWKLN